MQSTVEKSASKPRKQNSFLRAIKQHWILYLMFLPCVAYFLVFKYVPMVGVLQAFKEFRFDKTLFQSDWVGLKYFRDFFQSLDAGKQIRNTFVIGFIKVILEFPFPIILALMINEVKHQRLKKGIQTISYLPHFVSGVDPQLYEAARIDGAGKIREIVSITLPSIRGTIGIQFILGIGNLVSSSYEQMLLLRTPGNMDLVDTLDVFVIDRGLIRGDFAYATAIGLLQGIISLLLVVATNYASKKYSDVSVW